MSFPRTSTVRDLIHAIRHQPKLAKDASSALIDIGQSVHSNVTPDELRVLMRGTLYQEVYVRNACLQTLQVGLPCYAWKQSDNNLCIAIRLDRS